MKLTDIPAKQAVPFGVNGQREALLPSTPAGDNKASYNNGFPPVTMILKSAGGVPPKGQDMNQILFELSSLCRWFSAGGAIPFDSSFCAAISGYPKGARILGDDGATVYISTVDSNTNDPNTSSTGWLSLEKLSSIAGLAGGANKLPYFTSSNTAGQTDLTEFARTILAQPDANSVNSALGISGRLKKIVTITSSGTYTPSSGTSFLVVEGWGGGGGGGGAGSSSGNASVGGGGGAGGYFFGTISSVLPSYPIVIGAAGAAGTPTVIGGSGGSTSFGSLFTAVGGSGGQSYSAAQSAPQGGAGGGVGGGASGGVVNSKGMNGSIGLWPNSSIGFSGGGGTDRLGSGGSQVVVALSAASAGLAGSGYASGGGGAVSSNGAAALNGGDGTPGIIMVYEYY